MLSISAPKTTLPSPDKLAMLAPAVVLEISNVDPDAIDTPVEVAIDPPAPKNIVPAEIEVVPV